MTATFRKTQMADIAAWWRRAEREGYIVRATIKGSKIVLERY